MPVTLAPGQVVPMSGFITKALFLRQQPSHEIERRLGYAPGRLATGWWLLFLQQLPAPPDFEYMGYSYFSGGVAQGHLQPGPTMEQELRAAGNYLLKLKRRTIAETFRLFGPDRLAKVIPVAAQAGTMPYPPGSGVPQWKLIRDLNFKVVGKIAAGQVYSGDYS